MNLSPEHEALLILTCQQFPQLSGVPCQISPIVKGGSDRRFFRLKWDMQGCPAMILMVYTNARPDNAKFVPATHRLSKHGVNVPHLFAHDEDRLCVWMEDLGSVDLHSLNASVRKVKMDGYKRTLEQGAIVHSMREETLSKGDLVTLEPPFDESLYLWEQDYFTEHYLQGYRGVQWDSHELIEAKEGLKRLRKYLDKESRCLVHRDFQSQNVLLKEGVAWLVDYQGLRLGLAEYDLASLLYDPYVSLTEEERDELLAYYAQVTRRALIDIERNLYRCAAQRLMQALGAYCNLSRNLGKSHFERHIPAAEANLKIVCEKDQFLQPLLSFFD